MLPALCVRVFDDRPAWILQYIYIAHTQYMGWQRICFIINRVPVGFISSAGLVEGMGCSSAFSIASWTCHIGGGDVPAGSLLDVISGSHVMARFGGTYIVGTVILY